MDGQHSDRGKSEELDMFPGHWVKTCCCLHNPSDHKTSHTPGSQASEVNVLNLHIKLYNLMRTNQELLHINKKWAEQYTFLRQHCECQITELNRRLKICKQKTEEKEKTLGELTKNSQETELRHRLDEAYREIVQLRRQCDKLTNRGQQQEEELRRLNKRMNKSAVVQQESNQREENVWRHQAEVYKEDFLKERRDRDRLREKYVELEKRFKTIHTELDVYKTQVKWASSHPSTGPSAHT